MMYPKPTRTKKRKPDMKSLFREIWNERPHICENCGIPIPYMVAHNFSHKRSKGARPDLKYDKDNIEILCSSVNRPDDLPGCHTLHHRGKIEELKKRSKQ